MNALNVKTVRGHVLGVVVSCLQKAIRRGDGRIASYMALEMYHSGYQAYLWRRLFIISAEDCFDALTYEIEALYHAWELLRPGDKKVKRPAGQLFAVKAALLLSRAMKSRDADNAVCLGYERYTITDAEVEASLAEASGDPIAVPEYAHDCHTAEGRRAGKTKADFLRDEFNALHPRQPGLFDDDVNATAGR